MVEKVADDKKQAESEQAVEQRGKQAFQKVFGEDFHVRIQTVAGKPRARKCRCMRLEEPV